MQEQKLSVAGTHDVADEIVPVLEETAQISKRDVASGLVRVRTKTETIEHIAHADLEHDDIEVERIKIDKVVDVTPGIRTEGDLTIIPVLEEILFVETRLVLKEEIHIRRRIVVDSVSTPIQLRQQHAVIERDDAAGVDKPLTEQDAL